MKECSTQVSKKDRKKWKKSLHFPNTDVITEVRKGVYEIRHELLDLQPGSGYEVQVKVENKYGWSEYSDIYSFRTKKSKFAY